MRGSKDDVAHLHDLEDPSSDRDAGGPRQRGLGDDRPDLAEAAGLLENEQVWIVDITNAATHQPPLRTINVITLRPSPHDHLDGARKLVHAGLT